MGWAAGVTLAAGNAQVRFGPVKPRFEEGEGVTLQARISEGIAGVGPELLIAAKIFKTDAERKQCGWRARCDRAAATSAASRHVRRRGGASLHPGSYVMRLDVPQLAETLKLDQALNGKMPEASIEIVSREARSVWSLPPRAIKSNSSQLRREARACRLRGQ